MGFSDDLNKWNKHIDDAANKRVRKIGIEAYSMITSNSPVLTGALRANWFPTKDEKSNDVEPENTSFDFGRALKEFAGATTDEDLWITNNMPYAVKIEILGSTQGPPGAMINKTKNDLKALIESGKI